MLRGETFRVLTGRVDNLFGWRKPEYTDKYNLLVSQFNSPLDT